MRWRCDSYEARTRPSASGQPVGFSAATISSHPVTFGGICIYALPGPRPGSSCQQIFHMRGVEKLPRAEVHKKDIAAGQLDLDLTGMAGGLEEHRLLFQGHAALVVRQHLIGEEAGLIRLVLQVY